MFKESVKCVSRKYHKKYPGCFKKVSIKFCFAFLLLHGSHRSYPSRRRACFPRKLADKVQTLNGKFHYYHFVLNHPLRSIFLIILVCRVLMLTSSLLFQPSAKVKSFDGFQYRGFANLNFSRNSWDKVDSHKLSLTLSRAKFQILC